MNGISFFGSGTLGRSLILWCVVVLSGRFSALHPEGCSFEFHSSCYIGTFQQVLHLQLPVALRRVNSNTLSAM